MHVVDGRDHRRHSVLAQRHALRLQSTPPKAWSSNCWARPRASPPAARRWTSTIASAARCRSSARPNHPVVLTSLFDATVGAGLTPDGQPQNDTHNINGAAAPPTPPSTSGPIFLDGGDRDDHGSFSQGENKDGWKFLQQAMNFAYTNSLNTAGNGILVLGLQNDDQSPPQAQKAIESVADRVETGYHLRQRRTISTRSTSPSSR